jgi:hypothetical protein
MLDPGPPWDRQDHGHRRDLPAYRPRWRPCARRLADQPRRRQCPRAPRGPPGCPPLAPRESGQGRRGIQGLPSRQRDPSLVRSDRRSVPPPPAGRRTRASGPPRPRAGPRSTPQSPHAPHRRQQAAPRSRDRLRRSRSPRTACRGHARYATRRTRHARATARARRVPLYVGRRSGPNALSDPGRLRVQRDIRRAADHARRLRAPTPAHEAAPRGARRHPPRRGSHSRRPRGRRATPGASAPQRVRQRGRIAGAPEGQPAPEEAGRGWLARADASARASHVRGARRGTAFLYRRPARRASNPARRSARLYRRPSSSPRPS